MPPTPTCPTVVQPGPIHTGLSGDPDAAADRLLAVLVAAVARPSPS